MTEDQQRKTKDRSPNFPFINLAAAIQRAQQFYAEEKRGTAPFRVAVAHWGYSPTSSGAFQTAAALKSYGLMTDEESGEKRAMRLTELALRIILDQRPDSPDKPRLMRQAALSPNVAAEIYAKWPSGLPSRPSLHHYLVLDRGFGEEKAHSVVKILFENDELTGASSNGVDSPSVENDNEATNEVGRDQMSSPSMEGFNIKSVGAQPAAAVVAAGLASAQSVWGKPERLAFPGAEVIINYTAEPSLAVFDFIEQYMALRKKLFQAAQQTGASASSVAEPDKK